MAASAVAQKAFRTGGVRGSFELERILRLPVMNWESLIPTHYDLINNYLKLSNGTMDLHQWQAAAIAYAHDYQGAFISAGVGAGKTLVGLTVPVMLEAERPLYLVPASTRDKTLDGDIPLYRKHFLIHPRLRVMSYDEISRVSGKNALGEYNPDVIICDELHYLKNPAATRTKRFKEYLKHARQSRRVRLVLMSGTITKKSLRDFHHLLKLTLPEEMMPLPLPYGELEDWADAYDANPRKRLAPGALYVFGDAKDKESTWQAGLSDRIAKTPGIIFTKHSSCDATLILNDIAVEVPAIIEKHLNHLTTFWETPGGESCVSAFEIYRHARELACGLYYKWVWPKDELGKEKVNRVWLEARKLWKKFVRDTLAQSHNHGLDSELLVSSACARGDIVSPEYDYWVSVRDQYDPVTTTVWLDDFLIRDLVNQTKNRKALIWIEQESFGRKFEELSGIPYFAGGVTEAEILSHKGQAIALSAHAHKTGKNLQVWSDNIVVSCPPNGDSWEQMLGRTHRQGQEEDEVTCSVYLHTEALAQAFENALTTAAYMQTTTGQPQKIILANKTWS